MVAMKFLKTSDFSQNTMDECKYFKNNTNSMRNVLIFAAYLSLFE